MKRNFAVFRSSALCGVKNVLLEDLAANEPFIYRAQRSGFHRRAVLLRADSDRTRPMRGVKCSESFWQPVQRTTHEAHVIGMVEIGCVLSASLCGVSLVRRYLRPEVTTPTRFYPEDRAARLFLPCSIRLISSLENFSGSKSSPSHSRSSSR